MRALPFLILPMVLGACQSAIDRDAARLCRMTLPALNGEGTRIAIERTVRGPFPDAIRIDYRAIAADGTIRMRYVICRFDPAATGQGARSMTGLATEFGPMADASFYFLRRFWLEGGQAVDPDPQG
jgi:hypothetical protein